jgi:hypothetical protein
MGSLRWASLWHAAKALIPAIAAAVAANPSIIISLASEDCMHVSHLLV